MDTGYGGRIRTGTTITGTTIISVRIVILVKQQCWCEDGEDARGRLSAGKSWRAQTAGDREGLRRQCIVGSGQR